MVMDHLRGRSWKRKEGKDAIEFESNIGDWSDRREAGSQPLEIITVRLSP